MAHFTEAGNKEELCTDKLTIYMRNILAEMKGVELFELRNSMINAKGLEDLPQSFKVRLPLKSYLLPGNTITLIQNTFDEILPGRCRAGDLLTTKDFIWVQKNLKDNLRKYLDTRKKELDVQDDDQEATFAYDKDEVHEVVRSHSKHLFENVVRQWEKEATIKLENQDSSNILTIIYETPVVFLSSCNKKLQAILCSLENTQKQVVVIADEVIYIDCSLTNKYWHGTDITFLAKRVECFPPIKYIDLSSTSGNENAGQFQCFAKELVNMFNLSLQLRGCRDCRQPERDYDLEERTAKLLRNLFPPCATSVKFSTFVIENAFKLASNQVKIVSKPQVLDQADGIPVNPYCDQFYMEAEHASGLRFHVGFMKGYFTKNSFCLITSPKPTFQSKIGLSGRALFVKFQRPGQEVPLDKLGVRVDDSMRDFKLKDHKIDQGYIQVNNVLTEYPADSYKLEIISEPEPDCAEAPHLENKWVKFSKIEPKSENGGERADEVAFVECKPSLASLQTIWNSQTVRYGNIMKRINDEILLQSVSRSVEAEWWTNFILSDSTHSIAAAST